MLFYGFEHFKNKLRSAPNAFAEFIPIGKIMQVNICRLMFGENITDVGICLFQFGFRLDKLVEGGSVRSVGIFDLGQVKKVIVVKFIKNVPHFSILHIIILQGYVG